MRAISALVIAGTHSGVGKTTVSLGLMAALRGRALRVQPFKIGPDFIDPGLHARVCGTPSYNLDGWMLSEGYNRRSFVSNVQDKDVAVVEGMMGLYDGRSGATEEGSTAEMAKRLDLPVVLVVDAAAAARSVAAMTLGYREFDPKVRLVGVIFNRVAGPGHLQYLKQALKSLPGLICFGGIPTDRRVTIPERHLGLTVAEEGWLGESFIRRLARLIEEHVDLDRLLASTRTKIVVPVAAPKKPAHGQVPIAIANDRAFCFYYPDNLAILKSAGAKIATFSPILDRGLPKGTQGIYLGGGYPELYAKELSRNRSMRAAIKGFIEAGGPVYAECGGFMYLTAALTDHAKRTHPMIGVFPFKIRMRQRLQALGYREVITGKKAFAAPGEIIRGHEFHYSEIYGATGAQAIDTVYAIAGQGKKKLSAGYRYKNCLGSYVHLHFGSNPKFAHSFVAACRAAEAPCLA
jgi:cobyrinic acid a,c-diamide synthase